MRRKRLLWQLYPSYLLITLLSLLAVTWYASRSVRQFHLDRTQADLEAQALLVETSLPRQLSAQNASLVDSLIKELGKETPARLTLILPTGKVIADSEENPASMDNHADRPEIIQALTGQTGVSIRYSYTLKEKMMYVAVPVRDHNGIGVVVRTSLPVTQIEELLRKIYTQIALGGLLVALVAAAVSYVISRRITRPLEEMRLGAERFARGDLSHKLHIPDSHEAAALADAMNQMAAQLDARMRALARQGNEREAMLSSMAEGVLAVDTEERVITMNDAASYLLGVDPVWAKGRSIQEVVRNSRLQRFVRQVLAGGGTVEGDMTVEDGAERFLHTRGTTLRDPEARSIGAVIVLSDATNVRRLENIRREFVANVSHELKTPITSIKGFVETLLDGAMRDPEVAQRFLRIIVSQADRLNAIVDDLLSLAKIEEGSKKDEVVLEKGRLKAVLETAIQACESKARAKDITIDLSCADDIAANMNSQLLEQAVVNLIDNAIKYSEPGRKIEIGATQTDSEVIVNVRDEGCGIEREHLPRLFERFYRVDKARSRKLGGTGLGLAIVKHIVEAHGGRVCVDSTPGKGSIFSIHLPGD